MDKASKIFLGLGQGPRGEPEAAGEPAYSHAFHPSCGCVCGPTAGFGLPPCDGGSYRTGVPVAPGGRAQGLLFSAHP